MNAAIIALITAFAVPLGNASFPPVHDANVEYVTDSQAPTILEVAGDEAVQPGGLRSRWTSVTYELSTGQEAEAFLEIDERGRGDLRIYIDGDALMHVNTDERGGTSTWVAPNVDLPPAMLAELVSTDVADEVFSGFAREPLKWPCSKWARVAKYAWAGVIGAAAGVCCIGATTAGAIAACVACGSLAGVAMEAGSDIADDYCS